MVRTSPSLTTAGRYALRHPRQVLRVAVGDPSRVGVALVQALPARLRSAVAGGILRLTEPAVGNPGDHAIAAPLMVLAIAARCGTAAALETAASLPAPTTWMAASRLARVTLALGAPRTASALLAPFADTKRSTSPEVYGRIAAALGQYREAVGLLPVGSSLTRRLRGELALLQPGWQPVAGHAGEAGRTVEPARGTILHLLTNSLPFRQAGYTLRAEAVARAQQGAGLTPHMATRAGFPGNEGIVTRNATDVVHGIPYHRIEPQRQPDEPMDAIVNATARGLARLARELRPAALQPTTNYVNGLAALAVGEALGIPVVYEVRGFLEETWLSNVGADAAESDRYVLTRAAETACMARAAAIVTLSETMRADIVNRGIDPARVRVIPNAVDVERFTPGPRDAALAAQLGIEPDEIVIGYISSLTAYEGVEYLIDAVAELVAAGERVRLLVVGDGAQRASLISRARDRGATYDRAIFTGRVPFAAIQRYYRLIDLFVVPRTNDRVSQLVTPLKPYEAMAMAKALVVSDVAALREIVTDDETGRVFPAQDASALASVLRELLHDPATRERLGDAARAWVAANRTWAGNGQRYLELYRDIGAA